MDEPEFTHIFEIGSLKVDQKIRFSIESSEAIFEYLPFESTKSAKIETNVQMRLGYEIENKQKQIIDGTENIAVHLSDFKILSYDIKGYNFIQKDNGYFNKWQI